MTTQVTTRRIQDRNKRRRLPFFERLQLRLCRSRVVDGLWIGTFEDKSELVLHRVEAALSLIRSYDRLRYNRLIRDLERIWVRPIPLGIGAFNPRISTCELDARYVVAEASSTESIASTIVHEATHARVERCGIPYTERLRARIEILCFRQELAFAAKLPNGAKLHEAAQRQIVAVLSAPDVWADPQFNARYIEGYIDVFRRLGVPAPKLLVQFLLGLRNLRLRISRLFCRH